MLLFLFYCPLKSIDNSNLFSYPFETTICTDTYIYAIPLLTHMQMCSHSYAYIYIYIYATLICIQTLIDMVTPTHSQIDRSI